MRTAQPVAVTPVSRSHTRNESAAAAASARGICGWGPPFQQPTQEQRLDSH